MEMWQKLLVGLGVVLLVLLLIGWGWTKMWWGADSWGSMKPGARVQGTVDATNTDRSKARGRMAYADSVVLVGGGAGAGTYTRDSSSGQLTGGGLTLYWLYYERAQGTDRKVDAYVADKDGKVVVELEYVGDAVTAAGVMTLTMKPSAAAKSS